MNKETIYVLRGGGSLWDGAQKFSTPLKSAQLNRAGIFTYGTHDGRVIKVTRQEMFGEKYIVEPICPDEHIPQSQDLTRHTRYKISAIELATKN